MDPGGSFRSYRLPRTVVALGVVSLLTDVSSDMIFPLLPAFLAARISNAPLLLGSMEGAADLVSAAFKYLSGRWADRGRGLKRLVLAGYGLAAVARPLMAFVTRWWEPLLVRSADRVGKGLRTSPRDAMISLTVPSPARARAFGYQRGMDHFGAALGSLAAAGLVFAGLRAEEVFLVAAVPGLAAVAVLAWTREPPRPPPPEPRAGRAPVPGRVAWFLVPVALFGLANSTDAFLLLRLTEQGAGAALLPIAWLLLQAVKAAVSYPAGRLADRIGPSRVVVWGWLLYGGSYAALALSRSWPLTLGLIAVYGLYYAFSEGAERAILSSLVAPEAQGRAFGLYNGILGVAALVAGVLFGGVWTRFGATAAFWMAGAVALASAVLLWAFLPRARGPLPAA